MTDHPTPEPRSPEGVPLSPGARLITRRQRQVAALISRGASNREIGEALGVRERTVEDYVSDTLGKLGLRSRTQLALWALENGPLLPDADANP